MDRFRIVPEHRATECPGHCGPQIPSQDYLYSVASGLLFMSSSPPQPRIDPAAVGLGQKLYIWGGCGDSKFRTTSIESFNVSSLTWEQTQNFHGSPPDGLWNMAVTTDGQNAYTFGGMAVGPTCTVYEFNLSTKQCRELVPVNPSYAPSKKGACRMVCLNQKLVVYGGASVPGTATDELHVFDIRTSELGGKQVCS